MSVSSLRVPRPDGDWTDVPILAAPAVPAFGADRPPRRRLAYAAVHVVADAWCEPDGSAAAHWDREATLAFRHHVWDQGLGVAEAMDTAQRGGGLDWEAAKELIANTLTAAKGRGGAPVVVGVATDQLDAQRNHSLDAIIAAYLEQLDFVESRGGRAVIMASRQLARAAKSAADYERVYGAVLKHARSSVLLHWLGAMFDPQLSGYWGSADSQEAAQTVLHIMQEAGAKRVEGIKLSLLSEAFEVDFRSRLAEGQFVYTGDDFNYPQLIDGDGQVFSHALLGVFDPLAPVAAAALGRLDSGDRAGFRALLDPTVPLARHLFCAPTQFYKVGVVFLAWLNGHQRHFHMVDGSQSQRSALHLVRVAELAAGCGVLRMPELAKERLDAFYRTAGVA